VWTFQQERVLHVLLCNKIRVVISVFLKECVLLVKNVIRNGLLRLLVVNVHVSFWVLQLVTIYIAITNIDPVTGPQEGGTIITITGASFLETPFLLCKFGDKTTQATFVSPSEVQCTTPPGAPEEVAVKLLLNGKDFTSNDVLFEYQSTAARLATILLSVLGTIAGVSLVVAAIIFVIYKRKREKRVKLEEPDYSNLAFVGLLPDFSVSKTVEDPLHSLGELLLASDFSLVSSIVSSSQMSEVRYISQD
jgi:hypothetical protein